MFHSATYPPLHWMVPFVSQGETWFSIGCGEGVHQEAARILELCGEKPLTGLASQRPKFPSKRLATV